MQRARIIVVKDGLCSPCYGGIAVVEGGDSMWGVHSDDCVGFFYPKPVRLCFHSRGDGGSEGLPSVRSLDHCI